MKLIKLTDHSGTVIEEAKGIPFVYEVAQRQVHFALVKADGAYRIVHVRSGRTIEWMEYRYPALHGLPSTIAGAKHRLEYAHVQQLCAGQPRIFLERLSYLPSIKE